MAKPFLKWPGGKRDEADRILAFMSPEVNLYVELLVGGGAVFFEARERGYKGDAVLGDLNPHVMACYRAIKADPDGLIDQLRGYVFNAKVYERTVVLLNNPPPNWSDVEHAAATIYLNRTCFNGVWRVNTQGKFNVQMGDYKNPTICDGEGIRNAHYALQGVELRCESFQRYLPPPGRRTFMFFDPPYLPRPEVVQSFTSYTGSFGVAEHQMLAFYMQRMIELEGCDVVVCNADVKLAQRLYKSRGFAIESVLSKRRVNSDGEGRGTVNDLLAFRAGVRTPHGGA